LFCVKKKRQEFCEAKFLSFLGGGEAATQNNIFKKEKTQLLTDFYHIKTRYL
jgi:hypothetical protein